MLKIIIIIRCIKMNLVKLTDLSKNEIIEILDLAILLKKEPLKYYGLLKGKNLLFATEKPSLRTRLSFEVALNHLGGNCIYYILSDSTIGKKESWKDAVKNFERYVDIIALRVFSHDIFEEICLNTKMPVINALSDDYHPLQVLADLMTIKEKFGRLKGINIAYLGDANNNVTHSLILACAIFDLNLKIACPKKLMPKSSVIDEAKKIGKTPLISHSVKETVENADVIYTDTWESYNISKDNSSLLLPYQVNEKIMSLTNNAIFMHCLPAYRGKEVTSSVIDSKNSVVFDQAENRLHTQKALILKMLQS